MSAFPRNVAEWLGNPYELFRWLFSILIGEVVIVPFAIISDYYLRTFVQETLNHPPSALVNGGGFGGGRGEQVAHSDEGRFEP